MTREERDDLTRLCEEWESTLYPPAEDWMAKRCAERLREVLSRAEGEPSDFGPNRKPLTPPAAKEPDRG